MLSAVAGILMLFEFPIPIFPVFLEIDFSDLPALIASFMVNPAAGIIVIFIKIVINLLFTGTQTGFVGEAANFFIGVSFVLPAGLVYQLKKTKTGAVIGMLVGILSMAVMGGLANYYVIIPVFAKALNIPIDAIISMGKAVSPYIDSLEKMIYLSIVPFNILKGSMSSLLAFFFYKRLSHFLKD